MTSEFCAALHCPTPLGAVYSSTGMNREESTAHVDDVLKCKKKRRKHVKLGKFKEFKDDCGNVGN